MERADAVDVVDAGRVGQMHHLVAAHRDGSGLQVTPGSRLALSQVPTRFLLSISPDFDPLKCLIDLLDQSSSAEVMPVELLRVEE